MIEQLLVLMSRFRPWALLSAARGASAEVPTDPFLWDSDVTESHARPTDRANPMECFRAARRGTDNAEGFRQDKAGDANSLMLQGYRP